LEGLRPIRTILFWSGLCFVGSNPIYALETPKKPNYYLVAEKASI